MDGLIQGVCKVKSQCLNLQFWFGLFYFIIFLVFKGDSM